MEKIKNLTIFKFLNATDFKSKCIKLAILLSFMVLGLVFPVFAYISSAICIIYTLFEFSADSILYTVVTAIYSSYILIGLITALMWIYSGILIIRLIIDIRSKRVEWKNWRFVTILVLFTVLTILWLLPLCVTYSFASQFNKIALFLTIILTMLYFKDIKIKDFLIFFTIIVAVLCLMFYIINIFKSIGVIITQPYSKGMLNRFSALYDDPNFTGAIILCAIMAWFIAYKKHFINKYLYFAGLGMLGAFLLMTISKSCCLVLLLFAAYIVVENVVITIKTRNAKHLLELVYYMATLLFVCSVCWKYVDAMYQRFFNPGNGWWTEGELNNTMSNLTTGRSVLWKDYLVAIFSSWQIILFGAGASAEFISRGSAHCMPITYLYSYGLINCLLIVAILIMLVVPYLKHTKVYNFVPLVALSVLFCSIGGISIRYIFVFIIILLPICCNGAQNIVQDNKEKEEKQADIK